MERSLEEIQQEIEEKKSQQLMEVKQQEQNNMDNLPAKTNDGDDTAIMLQEQKKQALTSAEVQKAGNILANEDIKSDFANKAANIESKNMDAAELNLKNKKRKRQIDREEEESKLEHEYKMAEIRRNGEHKKMLDKRKKMVEKYAYLYNQEHMTKAIDGDGNEYAVPKDFSYSKTVNEFRQFGRNVSKLDKPLLQTIKWVCIIGGIVLGVFILKWTGIIK